MAEVQIHFRDQALQNRNELSGLQNVGCCGVGTLQNVLTDKSRVPQITVGDPGDKLPVLGGHAWPPGGDNRLHLLAGMRRQLQNLANIAAGILHAYRHHADTALRQPGETSILNGVGRRNLVHYHDRLAWAVAEISEESFDGRSGSWTVQHEIRPLGGCAHFLNQPCLAHTWRAADVHVYQAAHGRCEAACQVGKLDLLGCRWAEIVGMLTSLERSPPRNSEAVMASEEPSRDGWTESKPIAERLRGVHLDVVSW
jgi:hypothetical protein